MCYLCEVMCAEVLLFVSSEPGPRAQRKLMRGQDSTCLSQVVTVSPEGEKITAIKVASESFTCGDVIARRHTSACVGFNI